MDLKMLSVTKIEGEFYYKLKDVDDYLKLQRGFFNRTAKISTIKVTIQSPENLYRCTKENIRHPTESTQIKKVMNRFE